VSEQKFSIRKALAYGIGQFSDTIAIQLFVFYIFTFYYAVVGLDVNLITLVYILWSIWNSINDPLMGTISDKMNSSLGRRKPFIIISLVPLCIILFLLWTPVLINETAKFLYFLITAISFDLCYTTFDLNYASLFPEMFQNLDERAKANAIKQVFTVIGLIFAFLLPTFFIPKLDDPQYLSNYSIAGLVLAIIVAVGIIILLLFGVRERHEFSQDFRNAPPLLKSLKLSISNKGFRTFIIANLCYWYVIGMLPTIVPLYGSFVLQIGEGESVLLGLLLATTFISAAIFLVMWRFIAVKIGMRKGYMYSNMVFIITILPFMFINDVTFAFITFFLVGIGLGGALLFGDILLAAVIDEDELINPGRARREGGFYGINALITKLSSIFVILSINLVFNSTGWYVFDPILGSTALVIFGLRSLMVIFPIIALVIGIISIHRFPITKQRYQQIKEEIDKLHEEKKQLTRNP
jgi:glycoside/pentoside/hexuronide:cation symporter, GPH family